MLYVITGKQRSGKSYFCVTIIQDYLRSSNRPVYSNLPLHPDIICRGLFRSPAKYSLALGRIYLFKKFRSFGEAREFYKKNPDWCKLRQIIPEEKIKEFWRHTESNAVTVLDELYQWFSAMDYKGSDDDIGKRRRELLAYTRQHGHYKDDMFLVSHSADDIDINIRRGIQYSYVLSNSKYSNIFEKFSWLKGLRWPVQFFRVRGYEYGDKDYSDQWALWPCKHIFRCYDSFSKAESVPGKKLPPEDATSTDTGANTVKNILHFLKCIWLPLLIVVFVISVLYSGWKSYLKFVETRPKATMSFKQTIDLENGVSSDNKSSAEEKKQELFVFAKPLSITPNTIFYPNEIYKIGDSANGKTIVKISRQSIYFSDGSNVGVNSFCRQPTKPDAKKK